VPGVALLFLRADRGKTVCTGPDADLLRFPTQQAGSDPDVEHMFDRVVGQEVVHSRHPGAA